jgi:DNA-binding MarR family transcriptional regulator
MADTLKLTRNQSNVLRKLSESDDGLIGREFADIATATHGKWEWANGILKPLEAAGFVVKTDERRYGVRIWKITDAGRKALAAEQVTPAPALGDAPLSIAQRARLKQVAESHPWPGEYCATHVTNEALERRGLVTMEEKGRGWRDLRLTDKGLSVANEMFGLSLVQPEDPQAFNFD